VGPAGGWVRFRRCFGAQELLSIKNQTKSINGNVQTRCAQTVPISVYNA